MFSILIDQVFDVANLTLFSLPALKMLLAEEWLNVPEDVLADFTVRFLESRRELSLVEKENVLDLIGTTISFR